MFQTGKSSFVVQIPGFNGTASPSTESKFDTQLTEASTITQWRQLIVNPVLLSGSLLVASGLFHLLALYLTGSDWSGPVSFRKPGLFGVSAGLTIWSIAWVLSQLRPHRNDRTFACIIAGSLFLEVGLITMQFWRGVPSHFNRATVFDAMNESMMFGLIMITMAGIAWLVWRSSWIFPMPESRALAIRAGLWLLLISCGLGLLTAIGGELNIARNRSPEVWGIAGVLKYPHGAALHAIQVLPLLSGILERLRVSNAVRLVVAAVYAHGLFLLHSIWQLVRGRSRLDVDIIGGATLMAAGILCLLPITAIIFSMRARSVKRLEAKIP